MPQPAAAKGLFDQLQIRDVRLVGPSSYERMYPAELAVISRDFLMEVEGRPALRGKSMGSGGFCIMLASFPCLRILL